MRIVAFAPMHNTPGRKDATGAFQPEMKRFCDQHARQYFPPQSYLIDNHCSAAVMRKRVLGCIRTSGGFGDAGVAFFCHGTKNGIQLGFGMSDVRALAATMVEAFRTSSPVVTFYSCDVARDGDKDRTDDLQSLGGDGGFADRMRDELCAAGADWCVVDGHTTVGHTTRNPYVRRFLGHGNLHGGEGGFYIISPGGKLWSRWRQALKGTMRFDYPYLDQGEIVAQLTRR